MNRVIFCSLFFALLTANAALAQTYPAKPVRLIVP
ncbi:MAG: tripartite tricarboxylate transporter substrate binding protein, partial [Betaproteobacteria bacterium]|nr:tripartite tricarboxylate transporter substrate binding protein [Betaproteobacteria bacterium]